MKITIYDCRMEDTALLARKGTAIIGTETNDTDQGDYRRGGPGSRHCADRCSRYGAGRNRLGGFHWSTLQKYTWMSLQLSDGDRVDLFDSFTSGTESSFATVLHPDGTEQVVAVDPLAPGTSDFSTSPNTGQRFGTQWQVQIPSLNASLLVRADPQQQEILDAGGIFEGAALSRAAIGDSWSSARPTSSRSATGSPRSREALLTRPGRRRRRPGSG